MVHEQLGWAQFLREFCLRVSPRVMGVLDGPAWQKELEWHDRVELVANVYVGPTIHWKHNLGKWKIPVLEVGLQQTCWRCQRHTQVNSQWQQQHKIDAIIMCFRKDMNNTRQCRAVADAPGLFTTIDSLDCVCPHQMEDIVILVHRNVVPGYGDLDI